MSESRIGIDVDDLGLPPKEGLRLASNLRFRQVEVGTAQGDLSPANLSHSGRRHLATYVEGLGLELVSLTADYPRLRLTDPASVEQRVHHTCEALELASQLGVPTITAAVGVLTHPDTGEASPIALEALQRIGEEADARGIIYALRPSADTPENVMRLLDTLACPSLGVCLDPASMIMSGQNPVSLIERCAGRIALVHARDGNAGSAQNPGCETRLGEGEVDLIGLLGILASVEFDGTFVARRLDAADPAADLARARDLLSEHLGG